MELIEKRPTFADGFRKKTAQKQYKTNEITRTNDRLRNKNYKTYKQTQKYKRMKKILSLLTMLVLTLQYSMAGTATLTLNGSEVSNPVGFFTHDTNGKFSFNTKFNGATYDGIDFSSGLKMESTTKILFTTTEVSTVTIVQSTWSDKTIKLDETELALNSATAGTGCRIYTVTNVAAGNHSITRTSSESGLFYVKVEWVDAYTATFDNTGNWTDVYAYTWSGEGEGKKEQLGGWPGTELTAGTDGKFKVTVSGSEPEYIIFHNNAGVQTNNLEFKNGGEYNASGRIVEKTNYTATFTTEAEWEHVYAFCWNDTEKESALGAWPGTEITATKDEDGVYHVSLEAEFLPEGILFHNNDGWQTSDYVFEDNGAYTYNQTAYTVSFTTDAGWENVYAWAWSGSGDNLVNHCAPWPGVELEKTGDVYTFTYKTFGDMPEMILFNNGDTDNPQQTPDYAFVDGKAYEYVKHAYTATFTTDAEWESVYAYVWSGDGDAATNKLLGDWPGTALTAENNVYTVSIETYNDVPANIQFNNGIAEGTGAAKTHDMGFTNNHAYKWITATPLYALSEGDTFKAGTSVEVKDADGDVVATLTYGVSGGADFNAAGNGWGDNDDYEGFKYMTAGNGENGTATSGTVYTIVPVYDGTISVGVRLNGGKSFYIKEDDTSMTGYDGITMSDLYKGSFDFPVTAGKSYKIYCTGSKLGFYGFDYQFTKPTKTFTATFVNGAGWNPVKAYIWQKVGDKDVELNGEYPGQEISKTGTKTVKGIDYDIYTFTFETTKVSAEPGFIIFSDGTTTNKTEDLEFENEKEYEYGIPTGYSIVTKENDTWTVAATAMDEAEDEGVYSYSATLSGQAGKLFAIAPSTAINGETVNDAALVRPVTEGADWLIEFADYTGTTQNQAGGKVWQIAEANAADVTITFIPATKTFEVTNAIEYTMNDYGFATYSDGKKYKVEGAKANFITVSGNVATLVPQAEGAILPAMTGAGKGCGIIISADAGAKYSIKSVNQSEEAVNSSDNLLAGSGNNSYSISTQFADNDPYTAYIFTKPEGKKLGFYIADLNAGADLPAHKAFLAVPKGADAREFIGFEPGETTSIADNNRVTITNNGDVYNLNGQRVVQPTKGLYIVNGKKVVIR